LELAISCGFSSEYIDAIKVTSPLAIKASESLLKNKSVYYSLLNNEEK